MKSIFRQLLGAAVVFIMSLSMAPIGAFSVSAVDSPATSIITGDIIEYGSYPQSRVTDDDLVFMLNLQTLSSDNIASYEGAKYKRVYFTQYTPYFTSGTPSATNSYQDDNGYFIDTIYWFKYEPLKWRVLANTNGELFVMAESIVDSRAYNQIFSVISWETCSMRTWLNNDFYYAAFSSDERARIKMSLVDNVENPWFLTEGGTNTSDKLFLLSCNEIMNPTYGFNANYSNSDTARQSKGTDYSKSQGINVSAASSSFGNSHWWLRSPGNKTYSAAIICNEGYAYNYIYVDLTYFGVRPAFKINLKSIISQVTFDSAGGTEVTPLTGHVGAPLRSPSAPEREGFTFKGWKPALPETYPEGELAVTAQWAANHSAISIDKASLSMQYKSSATLIASVSPYQSVIWTSSNTNAVFVDDNGNVTAVGRGSATITATTADGLSSASCKVTVNLVWWQWILRIVLFGFIWY